MGLLMSTRNRHFPVMIILALILFIASVNLLADYWHLYYYIWWLDIPMHILGGLWIGLTVLSIYYRKSKRGKKDHLPLFVYTLTIATVLFIGIAWEIYEFAVDRVVAAFGISLGDSLKDLVDDLLGGVLAAFIFVRRRYNKE